FGLQAGASQTREEVAERTGLRARRGIAQIVTAPPDAMMLLRDVCEGQEMREGTRDGHGAIEWEIPQFAFERRQVGTIAAARVLGAPAHALHQIEHGFTLAFA